VKGPSPAPGSTRIRPVRADEYERLGDLLVEAYNSIPGSWPDPEYDNRLRAVAERAATASVLVIVDEGGDLLGGLTYVGGGESLSALADAPNQAEIRMFALRPSAQGRGVGHVLLEHAIERARDERRTWLWLSTSPWMTNAQRLYARLGFRRMPEHDHSEHSSGRDFELWAYVLDLETEPDRRPRPDG
jgi:ribosomal protein S18 acetylase RimI-like enzyme